MERKAYFLVIIAASLWGMIGIFTKQLGLMGFSVLQIVAIRAIISSITIFIILLFKDRNLLKAEVKHYPIFIGTGIVSFVFFNVCYFVAINKTTLSMAVILLYTAPIIVMILSALLFKERMTKRKVMALILTFVGCVLVTAFTKSDSGNNVTFLGVMAGLGAGLGYALYSIFGRYALEKYDSMTVTFYTFIFATIGSVPISNFKETIVLFNNIHAVYNALALGLLTTVLPFLLYTKGLSNLETSRASILATIEPVVATIIGIILFKEPTSIFKIGGILLVILSVTMIVEKARKPEKNPSA